MSPLQSCLVGQTKPFGEKISKIGQKKTQTPQKTEMAILAIFGLLPRIPIFSYWLVWSPNYSFQSLQPNRKVIEHTQ